MKPLDGGATKSAILAHQCAEIGRLGSRPFTRKETEAFFLDANGQPWTVHDRVDNNARADTGTDFRRKAKGVTRAAVE